MMNAIDIFPWNENFATGIQEIDDQHKRLIEILNKLAGIIAFKPDHIEINEIIDSLVDYTIFHFSFEENLWTQFLGDDATCLEHKNIHKQFIEEISLFRERQKIAAMEVLAEEILGYLTKWLAAHILESDRFLAYMVTSLREGHSLEQAESIANEKMSGATKLLIQIILTIYESLSTNSLRLMRELVERRKREETLQANKRQLEDVNSTLEQKVNDRTLELQKKNLDLEDALSKNNSLIRILSHDLANTIFVISSSAKLARTANENDSFDHKKHWEKVAVAAGKQSDLVKNVRELIAIKEGKWKVKSQSINLLETINQVIYMLTDRLNEKQLKLTCSIPKDLWIEAEPVSLENSVLGNILTNAIKFSKPGGVISISEQRTATNQVQLTISDTGIGIPKELLINLFSTQEKTSRPGTLGEPGSGFGMPLVKMYMEAYGGNVQIESNPEDQDSKEQTSSGTKVHLTFNRHNKVP